MSANDRTNMENNPGIPAFMRRWAADVNAAITNQGLGGSGWVTTTTTTSTTTTTV